jgi:hypothetical protein
VALPDYVRAVSKPNGRSFYYYEKFRRTERAWPRVRIPAAPLSEEFAKRVTHLPRLDARKDQAGAWEWSFLDVTDRRHPLPAAADCDAFWAAVDKADDIGKKRQAGIRRTFSALVIEFKESAAYQLNVDEHGQERPGLSKSMREQYNRYMDTIEAAWGDDPVESLQATDIQKVLDKAFRETPAAGRVFRSTLSRIISWGIPRGYRKDNPVDHTEKLEGGGTYSPWPVEAFDIFFEHSRVDLHLPVYSALFTGQRKVDVVGMLRPHSGATEMPLIAQKIKQRVPVQIHSEYRQIIDAAPVDKDNPQLALHLMSNGKPWTYEGIKTAWQREMDRPELKFFREKRIVFHGLRKNAVNTLLEVGCTEEMVSAIVGMSPAMVRHYAKEVSKFRLARSAMKLLEDGWKEQRVHVLGAAKKAD